MKSSEVSKMASNIMSKKRSYPNDAEGPGEVEADEADKGDFEGMSIDAADNGYSVRTRHKGGQGSHIVIDSKHPAASHIHAILKHAKK